MHGLLLGVALMVSATQGFPAAGPLSAAAAPVVFHFELPENSSRRQPSDRLKDSENLRYESGAERFTQGARPKRSKVERILAVAVGASVGFVVGARVGFEVTPTRGPYDDTSGLKGAFIGAPIGAGTGALLGYWLTR